MDQRVKIHLEETKLHLYKMQERMTGYPNSLLRPLATAVAAFPPPYLLLKSSLTRSNKAMGVCLPADSAATTQKAAASKIKWQGKKQNHT
jgi:hypothetical protein